MATTVIRSNHINHPHAKSALETFSLGYEYDVTWADAKKHVRTRTQK